MSRMLVQHCTLRCTGRGKLRKRIEGKWAPPTSSRAADTSAMYSSTKLAATAAAASPGDPELFWRLMGDGRIMAVGQIRAMLNVVAAALRGGGGVGISTPGRYHRGLYAGRKIMSGLNVTEGQYAFTKCVAMPLRRAQEKQR